MLLMFVVILGIISALLIPKSFDMNVLMEAYLKENQISIYQIYEIDDYKSINYTKRDYKISKKDINKYIKDDLEAREENVEVLNRDYVKRGDVVSVSYAIYLNGEKVNYVENDVFMVGKGKYNEQIEDNIIGKKKNKKITFSIQVPHSDNNKVFAGKFETVKLYIKSISVVKSYKLNKEFVSKFYGFNTLDEYYKYVKKELEAKNDYENYRLEKEEILSNLSKCFRYNLKKEEIAKYSLNIIDEYTEIASVYNKSLDEYREENLGMTENEFMNKCYAEGKERLEQYIAIGVVSQLENVSVSQDAEDIEQSLNKLIDETIELLKTKYLEKRKETGYVEQENPKTASSITGNGINF